jgi:hypothetical protein
MLNALTSYQFDECPVRVVMVEGEPWFVANDVASVLGYRDGPTMTRNLDDDERGTHIVCTPGGDQAMTIICESGLYNAIFKSKRVEAQRFRKWVTAEVLPELRRTGSFQIEGIADPTPMVDEDFDPVRLAAAVSLIREARLVWGPVGTRDIWIKLGLPAPIADSEAIMEADSIVADLRRVVEGKTSLHMDELLELLGVEAIQRQSMKLRRRITEGMRLIGWRRIKERRGGQILNVFACPERLAITIQEGR